MTIYDESDRVPPEARTFTAPPDEQHTHSESSGDASALSEYLASAKTEIGQLRADTDTIRERFSAKWRRRAATLEAIQPTGNIAEDAKVLCKADETNPSQVNSRYNLKDENGIIKYLGDLRIAANAAVGTEHNEDMQAYYQTLAKTIERIIAAYKTPESRNVSPDQD